MRFIRKRCCLIRETLSLPLLKAGSIDLFDPQSGTGLEDLLDAFGFTPYANYYSEQNDRVRVFVDDVSTLRVNAAGLIQYAAGADSTVRAYDAGGGRRPCRAGRPA